MAVHSREAVKSLGVFPRSSRPSAWGSPPGRLCHNVSLSGDIPAPPAPAPCRPDPNLRLCLLGVTLEMGCTWGHAVCDIGMGFSRSGLSRPSQRGCGFFRGAGHRRVSRCHRWSSCSPGEGGFGCLLFLSVADGAAETHCAFSCEQKLPLRWGQGQSPMPSGQHVHRCLRKGPTVSQGRWTLSTPGSCAVASSPLPAWAPCLFQQGPACVSLASLARPRGLVTACSGHRDISWTRLLAAGPVRLASVPLGLESPFCGPR